MECMVVCPDTALPNTAQEIRTVIRTAVRHYVKAEQTRNAMLDRAVDVETAVRKQMLDIAASKERTTVPAFADLVADGTIDPAAAIDARAVRANAALWRRMQRRGKVMSVIRLIKASFTFAGGIDYLAWKINRHAGTQIVISPWQRRHPLLAAIMLLPRLLGSRAVG